MKAVVVDKGVKEESQNGTANQVATTSFPKRLFKIGDIICKFAKQLSESPTVLQELKIISLVCKIRQGGDHMEAEQHPVFKYTWKLRLELGTTPSSDSDLLVEDPPMM
ncbi:hypothetical protein Tco_0387201 [Tanacetum coccineum]